MFRLFVGSVFWAVLAVCPAAAQTVRVPPQTAPLSVAPPTQATVAPAPEFPVVRAVPRISPLSASQRAEAALRLGGIAAPVGPTTVLTPRNAVSENGAALLFRRPHTVSFVPELVTFLPDERFGQNAVLLSINLPDWPAGAVLVDCHISSDIGEFRWGGSGIEGSATPTNGHLMFVVPTSGPSQQIGIVKDHESFWQLTRCELTRLY